MNLYRVTAAEGRVEYDVYVVATSRTEAISILREAGVDAVASRTGEVSPDIVGTTGDGTLFGVEP